MASTLLTLFDIDQCTCLWRLASYGEKDVTHFAQLDLLVGSREALMVADNEHLWQNGELENDALLAELCKHIREAAGSPGLAAFTILLAAKDGYWLQGNIITHRFLDCEGVEAIKECKSAGDRVSGFGSMIDRALSVNEWLKYAVAVVIVKPEINFHLLRTRLDLLREEARRRLMLPLTSETPIARRNLALLRGRSSWSVGAMIYQAAHDLGIDLYVLDRPGHWIEEGRYRSFYKALIPIDMTIDASLPRRITQTLRDYPVAMDGLLSFNDTYLIPAAEAAEALGLPTTPLAAIETCRDKYLSRSLSVPSDFQCVRLDDYAGAVDFLANGKEKLRYPLIVKPCAGYGSEGVAKVRNEEELLAAVRKANQVDYARGCLVTVETYIDGPEIDANLVMCDGRLLFCDICDQPPTEADLSGDQGGGNFLESDLILPSGLPAHEQITIRDTMLGILKKIGCHTGVYHMEARLRDSAMEWHINGDQILDLRYKTKVPASNTSAVLIENNCRPPNHVCCQATLHTYGVNYPVLHFLFALGDTARAQALAIPFLDGPQYHCDLGMIPVTKGGKFMSADPMQDLWRRDPELMRSVVKSECFFAQGDEVPDPSSGELTWIAGFHVSSRTRHGSMRSMQQIRQKFVFELEC